MTKSIHNIEINVIFGCRRFWNFFQVWYIYIYILSIYLSIYPSIYLIIYVPLVPGVSDVQSPGLTGEANTVQVFIGFIASWHIISCKNYMGAQIDIKEKR